MRRRRQFHRNGEAGFAMIEALIAFAVMAIGLGTLAGGIAVALRANARGASTLEALRFAQSLYAQVGTSIALEPKSDEDERGFRWRIAAQPVDPAPSKLQGPGVPAAASSPSGAVPGGLRLIWVSVTVEAPGGGEAALTGLKAAPNAGPPR